MFTFDQHTHRDTARWPRRSLWPGVAPAVSATENNIGQFNMLHHALLSKTWLKFIGTYVMFLNSDDSASIISLCEISYNNPLKPATLAAAINNAISTRGQ